MTVARGELVDLEVTRYYHCISRCVRRAFLCGEGFEHRKQWIEERLEALAKNFTVSVCGFAIMDKERVTSELRGIFERLGISAEFWEHRLKKLFGKSRLLGSYFATSRERLQEIAARRGVRHVDNAVPLAATG